MFSNVKLDLRTACNTNDTLTDFEEDHQYFSFFEASSMLINVSGEVSRCSALCDRHVTFLELLFKDHLNSLFQIPDKLLSRTRQVSNQLPKHLSG